MEGGTTRGDEPKGKKKVEILVDKKIFLPAKNKLSKLNGESKMGKPTEFPVEIQQLFGEEIMGIFFSRSKFERLTRSGKPDFYFPLVSSGERLQENLKKKIFLSKNFSDSINHGRKKVQGRVD